MPRELFWPVLLVVAIHLYILLLFINSVRNYKNDTGNVLDELMNTNVTSEQVLAQIPPELHKYLMRMGNFSGNSTHISNSTENIPEIVKSIQRYNEAQTIHNEDVFGPVQNDTIIVAIMVHKILTYLRHLVISLAQAKGIERTLLIFSHDFFDDEINSLVQSIDFCKVLQIFYPFSIQTHPKEFPGDDPKDCPKDATVTQAVKLSCNNAKHPDVDGHYRQAKHTQAKHHWWWRANRIFNQLHSTRDHIGMVVFLDEDHYVAQDFFYVLMLMRKTADSVCPQCVILCMGTDITKCQHYASDVDKVEINPWVSGIDNMGVALNRTIWREIVEVKEQFCAYDDYNYDWSLLHLSQNSGRDKYQVMQCKGPRVFHIGVWDHELCRNMTFVGRESICNPIG